MTTGVSSPSGFDRECKKESAMATIRSDRERFLELGDIFRELQFLARDRRIDRRTADRIIRLASEGLSPSEIRSEIIGLAAGNVL